VHADVRAEPLAFTRIVRALDASPSVIGGAYGGFFDAGGAGYRIIELANDFRSVFCDMHFGDQTQFFRREPVMRYRLFAPLPLMEDVELSLRLHHAGRQVYLFGDSTISPRRWRGAGRDRTWMVLRTFCAYMWYRVRGPVNTDALYRRYYGLGRGAPSDSSRGEP
jgi:hypothetical protein